MFSKLLSKFVRKSNHVELDYSTMLAPAALATVVVIGVNTMKNVENDIRVQTRYPQRYTNV